MYPDEAWSRPTEQIPQKGRNNECVHSREQVTKCPSKCAHCLQSRKGKCTHRYRYRGTRHRYTSTATSHQIRFTKRIRNIRTPHRTDRPCPQRTQSGLILYPRSEIHISLTNELKRVSF